MGLEHVPGRLIARVHSPFFPNLYIQNDGRINATTPGFFYHNNAGVSGSEIVLSYALDVIKPNGPGSGFPYGIAVDPDHG